VGQRRKAVHAFARDDHHAAAVAAVAAVRPTVRDVLLSPETHAAGTAVTGVNFDFDAIDKHAELDP
jgi:hypothetical protein